MKRKNKSQQQMLSMKNTTNSKKGLFSKLKKEKDPEIEMKSLDEEILDLEKSDATNPDGGLSKGVGTARDFIAPPSFYRGEPEEGDWMKVGDTFVRPFVMQGFPSAVSVGWLDSIYNHDGDMDVALHINPADDREALDELTNKIVQFESQYAIEAKKGNIRNLTKLKADTENLYLQRQKLEQNQENLFYVQIAANLYAEDKETLDKETQKLDNKLKGRKIYMMPTYLQQDEGYKSALPYGKTYLPDKFRNFNTGAMTSTFPFYNSEVMHERGILIAQNGATGTPILIDFYDKTKLNNANATIFGKSGSGKTFFVSLLTMRSAARGVRTAIIDPEGEYRPITEALGGAHINIAPGSKHFINPFDIEADEELDEKTGMISEYVDINAKISDLMNLIAVMNGGLDPEERALVSEVLRNLYEKRGITADPKSLKISEDFYDEASETFFTEGKDKPMPVFSDFYEELQSMALKQQSNTLSSMVTSLKIFKKGEVYDLFDTQTSDSLKNFKNAPIVTFDISKLEESILRPIGMYITLQWTWEKFVKKNPTVVKRVVCDEAWMLVNTNMAGHEMTGQFLENAARRIRKRNGGLVIASQNFREFDESKQGRTVLNNAQVKFFLQQDAIDINALQDRFHLSDGEANYLLRAKRGELLLRIQEDSAFGKVFAFPYEKELIDRAKAHLGAIS